MSSKVPVSNPLEKSFQGIGSARDKIGEECLLKNRTNKTSLLGLLREL